MTSVTEENIHAVHNLIDSDRRIKISEIVSAVGVSYGSDGAYGAMESGVQVIISNNLNFLIMSARWVPHLVTQEQKRVRQDVCCSLESIAII